MSRMDVAVRAVWSKAAFRDIRDRAGSHGVEIVHFHNTFPLISPAGYYAARSVGAKVIQTLHNYRWMCAVATLYRNGAVCEECFGRWVAWPGVRYGCYHSSRGATAAVAAMLAVHHALRTWRK